MIIEENFCPIEDSRYDFIGESYKTLYPNLHRYPATMLPQIGFELLKEFGAKKTNLLDPYCGSGSSFISGLEYDIKEFYGFDLNPLAIMISKAKLTFIDKQEIHKEKEKIQRCLESAKIEENLEDKILTNITNIDFWISKKSQKELLHIWRLVIGIKNKSIKNLFLLAFSETLREVSYTRNNEFKLFRMKDYESFNPDSLKIFNQRLENVIQTYLNFYQSKIKNISFELYNQSFTPQNIKFDTLLTSPPYGDSRTTVAYGQFSTFINEWLGFKGARKLDANLLGGKKSKVFYLKGFLKEYILEIKKIDIKRALEISSFYFDLEESILSFLNSLNFGAKVFFVVGNRTVKGFQLPTDQFVAEVFTNNGFCHIKTLKRKISNKAMPLLNSPTNKSGKISQTMNNEWIVVCEKKR